MLGAAPSGLSRIRLHHGVSGDFWLLSLFDANQGDDRLECSRKKVEAAELRLALPIIVPVSHYPFLGMETVRTPFL